MEAEREEQTPEPKAPNGCRATLADFERLHPSTALCSLCVSLWLAPSAFSDVDEEVLLP
jgi:hypothetical protein